MLNSGKKKKKLNIITLVLSENKILNETKNHNPPPPLPPFKLNGRSLRQVWLYIYTQYINLVQCMNWYIYYGKIHMYIIHIIYDIILKKKLNKIKLIAIVTYWTDISIQCIKYCYCFSTWGHCQKSGSDIHFFTLQYIYDLYNTCACM